MVAEDALAAHVEVALAAAVQARRLAGLQVEQGAAPGKESRGVPLSLKMCDKIVNIKSKGGHHLTNYLLLT